MVLGKRCRNERLEFLSPLLVLGVTTRLIDPTESHDTTTLGAEPVLQGRDIAKPSYEVTWELTS